VTAATNFTTYREGSLHAALKALYARPGDLVEGKVDGFVVDVVREDELIEIQTASFSSMTAKLEQLTQNHRVALVHPIAAERWLLTVDADGAITRRTRSPKRGVGLDLFHELVAFPALIDHPNFRIELVLIREEEVRGPVPDGARYRHPRQWWRLDRRLVEVVDVVRIDRPADLAGLLPPGLPETFTSADIAAASRRPKGLAMRTAYCLTRAGVATCTGRRGRLQTYRLTDGPTEVQLRAAETPLPLDDSDQ
jgi:hypothetical protein